MCAFKIMFTTELKQRRSPISPAEWSCPEELTAKNILYTHTHKHTLQSHRTRGTFMKYVKSHADTVRASLCLCVYFSLSYLTTSSLDQSSYVSTICLPWPHSTPRTHTFIHHHTDKHTHTEGKKKHDE